MLILRIWSRSKPTHGRYLYKGHIYTKSPKFVEIEKSLYVIRCCLKVLFCFMAVILSIILKETLLQLLLRIVIVVIFADLCMIPMYYMCLSNVIDNKIRKF